MNIVYSVKIENHKINAVVASYKSLLVTSAVFIWHL